MDLRQRLIFIIHSIWYFIWTYPIRLYRVPRKVIFILYNLITFRSNWRDFTADVFGVFLLIGDLFGIPEIYDSLQLIIKGSTRIITDKEKGIIKLVMGECLPSHMIKIDEKATFLAKKGYFAYVSFFTINLYGNIRSDIFVHELIHIWQYTRYGSEYISKALFAQHSKEGYDYGGLKGITEAYSRNKSIEDFNFEQQGDILADFFRNLHQQDQLSKTLYFQRDEIYSYFVNQIINLNIYRW